MGAVLKYELKRYLVTPVGYVFIAAFLILSSLLFYFYNLSYASGNILGLFTDMTSFLMFLVPVLTMRSFAEERRNRSDQFLMTAPISPSAIVLGKFLAVAAVYVMAIALTTVDVAIVGVYGRIYWGETLLAYLGFLLLSGCYLSSGLFVSSLCENQVSAAVLTFALHFGFSAVDWLTEALPACALRNILSALSLYTRFQDVENALLTPRFVVYTLSMTALFLYLTVLSLKSRRWGKR